jgi:polysaccharide biosynthesis transport protein
MIQQAAPASINLLDVLKGVLRRKLFILGTTGLAFAAGLAFVKTATPTYMTDAQVLIENLSSPFDKTQVQDDQRSDPVDDRVVLSQVSVLKSQDLALRVIEQLKLQERPEFDRLKTRGVGPLKSILLSLGFGKDPRLMTPAQRALEHYYDGLTVYQVPLSSVIALEFSAQDAATAAEVLNTLTSQYVAETAEARSKPTSRARDWLGQQIADLRRKVEKSEAAVEKYRSDAGLLRGQNSTLSTQELSELNTQMTVAETTRTEAQERARSIRRMLDSSGTVDDSIDVLNSPIIQRLREQQVTSARKVAELSATYLNGHPKMIAARNDLRNVDKQIRAEALKIVGSLQEQSSIAAARQAALKAKLDDAKGLASAGNLDEVKLKALERESAADRSLLESLLLRYADASARQDISTQPGLARIIQQASVPSLPSFPKTGPIVLLLTLAGFILSLALAFLYEVMNAASGVIAKPEPDLRQRRLNQAEFARHAPIPPPLPPGPERRSPVVSEPPPMPAAASKSHAPLAIFPLASSVPANLEVLASAYRNRDNPMHGATKVAADWVVRSAAGLGVKRYAVVAVGAGSLASSASTVALARAIAQAGKRVVMLDLVPVDTGVNILSGLPAGPGLVELLAGKTDFTTVVARDPISLAHVMRYGLDHSDGAAQSLHAKIDQVLSTLDNIYDIILINAGELSSTAQVLAGKVQGALLLAPPSRQREVSSAVEALKDSGLEAVEFIGLATAADPGEMRATG